jgi:predicted nuclease of restriction endonuclease-like (RecB) superfamily
MDEEMLPNQFITGDVSVSGNPQYLQWIESVKSRYRQSQIKAHLQVNTAMLEFNWYLGRDISEIMRTRIWGSGVVNQVSLDLKAAFPEAQGFSKDNLYRMAQFYRFYSEQKEIVAQVVRQLQPAENKTNTIVAQLVPQIKNSMEINADSAPVEPFPFFLGMVPWGHHIEILQSCKDLKEAVFYIEKTIQNNWSRAMLSHAIAADFYKDAAKPLHNFVLTLPKPQGDLAAELMKSELNLGFLHLKEGYNEEDLEYALVNNLRRFLLEMGPDFLLKGQQIEFTVGGESGKIDLLLYNLELMCYYAIELKVKPFQSEWVGQLSLYVTAVDKLIKRPKDNPTIGILICQKANREKVKWTLEGFNKPMGVSTYTDNLMRMVEEHLDALQVVTDDDASCHNTQ